MNSYNTSRIALIALLLLSMSWVNGSAQTYKTGSLKVGDPAPPIVVSKWIKRGPVTEFKPGMVYAVEFWATWCGPCQAAMPHLSELAVKYEGKVQVLSIDVKEQQHPQDTQVNFLPKVEHFVKSSGDRMNYAVAVDAAGDIMEKTWLKAVGSNGIPDIFIIDQQGKIAWHGLPAFVDDVLEAVVKGAYDEAGKQRIEAALNIKKQLFDSLGKKTMAARKIHDYQAALETVEEVLPIFPAMNSFWWNMKYEFLSHIDSAKARQFGDTLIAKWHPTDQVGFAYPIMGAQPDGAYKPDYGFALKIIKQAALNWDPEDKSIFSFLARAYYKTGNKEQAVKCQEKYFQLLKKDTSVKPQALEYAQKALKQYRS